jgi:hypothetical protein
MKGFKNSLYLSKEFGSAGIQWGKPLLWRSQRVWLVELFLPKIALSSTCCQGIPEKITYSPIACSNARDKTCSRLILSEQSPVTDM